MNSGGTFVELISVATVSIAVFAAVLGFAQRRFPTISRQFSYFALAVAFNNLAIGAMSLLAEAGQDRLLEISFVVGMVSGLSIFPLFWFYVHALTSAEGKLPTRRKLHLSLPVFALILGTIAMFLPIEMRDLLFRQGTYEPDGWGLVFFVLIALISLAFYPQLVVYLVLIIRRLLRYRQRLRSLYSSTEEHELRWIWGIGLLGLLFVLAQGTVLWLALRDEVLPFQQAILALPGFAAFLIAAFFGLRQRPALIEEATTDAAPAPAIPEKTEKYEKSALSPTAAARIERKLRAAMETDHLHRDPNLSLWVLARHIGATPNNVSQTLNDKVGESFFDFVNGYRIEDAKRMLNDGSKTVLTITYEVGFNSRSSFYTAFKRVTGQTPSGYRKTLSVHEGSDDRT